MRSLNLFVHVCILYFLDTATVHILAIDMHDNKVIWNYTVSY